MGTAEQTAATAAKADYDADEKTHALLTEPKAVDASLKKLKLTEKWAKKAQEVADAKDDFDKEPDATKAAKKTTLEKLKKELVKAAAAAGKSTFWESTKEFIFRPKTLWSEARANKDANGVQIDAEVTGGLGVFGTLKHMFWPTSKSGCATAVAAVGAAAAVGVAGRHKYKKYAEMERKRKIRENWGKAGLAAAGLAATGAAAFGGYKAWEAYKARKQPDGQPASEETSEKETDQAVGAPGKSKKKNGKKTKAKGSMWMIWAAVIVLGLAVIGGAVYYFLFMTEEGSEEDAVPEGMDQV